MDADTRGLPDASWSESAVDRQPVATPPWRYRGSPVMETERLRSVLETAGLSQYQADAYVALVELGNASAVEVANACDVPQARIYDVLRDLDEMGYVETYEHRSLHARAHDPAGIVDDLKSQAQAALDAATEIESRWQRPALENHDVSVVNQFETVLRRAREYVDQADVEVQLSANAEQFAALSDELAAAVDRDVVVELLWYSSGPDDAIDPEDLSEQVRGHATEVRTRQFTSPFMLLVDRTSVAFAPQMVFHPSNEYGMVINDYSLGHVFEQYFQSVLWEGRPEAYATRDTEPPVVYTRVRQCLRDIIPPFEDGATIDVRVEGRDRSGEHVTIEGVVEDLVYSGPTVDSDADPSLARFADQATIVLEADGDTYQVGGFGAVLEDVEARRIVVEAIRD